MTVNLNSKNYYETQARMLVGVDCVIFGLHDGNLKLLLIKRDFEPCRGEWSLMGGFVNEDESVVEAARRVLYELTGLHSVFMIQTGAFGAVDRDPGERVVSVAYTALLDFNMLDHEELKRHNAYWVNIDEIPPMCFDHSEMIAQSRMLIKKSLRTEPLAFSLLPENFTLTQLQRLFEAVEGTVLDKRNFRRRILENESIEDTGIIDRTSSKRGARLYRYRPTADGESNFKL